MGQSVLIASGKGGVGKSTIAVLLCRALARDGSSCILVDGDIGLRCADLLLGMQDRVIYDLFDVTEGNCPLDDALYPVDGYDEKFFLLSSSQTAKASEIRAKDIRNITEELKKKADYVFLDAPAGIGRNIRILLEAADRAILVSQLDPVCMRDTERTVQFLTEHGVNDIALIMNRVRKAAVLSGRTVTPSRAAEAMDLPLIGIVPETETLARLNTENNGFLRENDAKLKRAIGNIALRLSGASVPLPVMEGSPVYRFFHRL